MSINIEQQVGELLSRTKLKLCLAESCTGGLISHLITNIPGSSEYLITSVVAYAYEAKETLLGVKNKTLLEYGAVSRETVIEMAQGVRANMKSFFPMDQTIGLSVSGIAGPSGGMPGKPVGLVWIGLSTLDGDWAYEFQGNGNRIENKQFSAQKALEILRDYLLCYEKERAS